MVKFGQVRQDSSEEEPKIVDVFDFTPFSFDSSKEADKKDFEVAYSESDSDEYDDKTYIIPINNPFINPEYTEKLYEKNKKNKIDEDSLLNLREEMKSYINGQVEKSFKKLLIKHKKLLAKVKTIEEQNQQLLDRIQKLESNKKF